jgi:hypothetical protein
MMDKVLSKETWERRRIEMTLRVLGRVDTMLTMIRERAGKQLDSLERTRAKLDEQKKVLDAATAGTIQNAA